MGCGNLLILLVPEARLELAQGRTPGDFESPASTNSTTPATVSILSWELYSWQAFYGEKEAEFRGVICPEFTP